jgi:hypothetical protein
VFGICPCIRLLKDLQPGSHLFDVLIAILVSRKRSKVRDRIDALVGGCLSNITVLWHCRLGQVFWNAFCPLEAALLKGAQRIRRLPLCFKSALIKATTADRGNGVRRPGQLLVGIQAMKKRRGETSLSANQAGLDCERFNCWNYWLSLRHAKFANFKRAKLGNAWGMFNIGLAVCGVIL